MKKSLQVIIIAAVLLCAVCFTGCSAPQNDELVLDSAKLATGTYTFATRLVNGDSAVTYDTVYVIEKYTAEDGKEMIRIQSSGKREGQTIYSRNELLGNTYDGRTAFSPVSIFMEYHDKANSQNDVIVNVSHSFKDKKFDITVKSYADGALEMTEQKVTVNTEVQYYDSESLPFVIGCLPLEKGMTRNFTLSSSNRDQVQSMKLTVADVVQVDVNQQKVECYAVVIQPNTPFTHYATYMYYRTDNQQLVMIKQENTSFTLTDYTHIIAEITPNEDEK